MIVRKWGRANVQLGSGQLSRPGLDWANQGRAESSHPRSPAFAPKHPTWTNEYPPTGPKHPGDAWKLQGIFLCTYHIFLCVNFILFHAFCEIPEAKFVFTFLYTMHRLWNGPRPHPPKVGADQSHFFLEMCLLVREHVDWD